MPCLMSDPSVAQRAQEERDVISDHLEHAEVERIALRRQVVRWTPISGNIISPTFTSFFVCLFRSTHWTKSCSSDSRSWRL
jgi:hypothetical protein